MVLSALKKYKKSILWIFLALLAMVLINKTFIYIMRMDPTEFVDIEKGIYFQGQVGAFEEFKTPISTQELFPGLTFKKPVGMIQAPYDQNQWFIIEQRGTIQKVTVQEGIPQKTEWINLQNRVADPNENWEHGLLGLAFAPDFQKSRLAYLYYLTPDEQSAGKTRAILASYQATPSLDLLDRTTEKEIFSLGRPGPFHHGGTIRFGADGLLYFSMGDGDGVSVMGAQDPADPNGTISRMNPLGKKAPEVFAWGLRNPWFWSFDRKTGDIWTGDVGANLWEEINRVEQGKNYGWPLFEGPKCKQRKNTFCSSSGLEPPVIAHHHQGTEGIVSITGGFVYRGKNIPALQGIYLYAGFLKGTVYGVSADSSKPLKQKKTIEPHWFKNLRFCRRS